MRKKFSGNRASPRINEQEYDLSQLRTAVYNNKLKDFDALLNGFDKGFTIALGAQDNDGNTLLMTAVEKGYEEMTQFIIKKITELPPTESYKILYTKNSDEHTVFDLNATEVIKEILATAAKEYDDVKTMSDDEIPTSPLSPRKWQKSMLRKSDISNTNNWKR